VVNYEAADAITDAIALAGSAVQVELNDLLKA
jgi:hypothetical protein